MDVGGLRHRAAVGQGKIWQRLPGQGEEVQIHSRSQSSLQITVAKSSGENIFNFFHLFQKISVLTMRSHKPQYR